MKLQKYDSRSGSGLRSGHFGTHYSNNSLKWNVPLKSASGELVQDIPGYPILSTIFFGLWAAGVPRVIRKRSESMRMLTGARIHAVAVHITLPDAEDAYIEEGTMKSRTKNYRIF